ncbi:MAG: sensor domain-containing diguanylate cyclase [Halanaerobiales bacterium]
MDKVTELALKNKQLNKKIEELNNNFAQIIEFTNKFKKLSIEKENVFWAKLLKTAMNLIKKADFGSVYKYSDGKVEFIDTVGHNCEVLKNINIDEEVFQMSNRINQVTIIDEVINYTKSVTTSDTFSKVAKASKPIKTSITFDLYFKDKPVGGLTLDIKKGREAYFDEDDKKILNYLLNITEAFYRKDAEKRLKEQQAYFQQLFDESTEAIALLDNRGNIIKVNETFEDVFGYTSSEIRGEDIDELIVPEEKKEEGIRFTNAVIKNKDIETESIRLTKKGEKIDVSIHAFPISLDEGQIGIYAIYNDITERKETEKKLKRQKAYFQQLFDESTEAIALLNNDNKIIKVNKSFEDVFGYTSSEIRGEDIDELIVPEEKKEEGIRYTNAVIKNKDIEAESIRLTKNGEKINVSIHAFPISLDEGQIGIYAIYNDITQRKKEEKKIKYLSFHDQMTGLYNRRYFESEMERLDDSRALPISIIMTDIDRLKHVNDNFGHAKGDQYIKVVAKEIKAALRNEDILARVGGDEFAILLPETEKEEAEMIEKRIQENIDQLNGKYEFHLGISTGSAVKKKSDKDRSLENVFMKADYLMYKMKNRG